jgi:hypothetical protein
MARKPENRPNAGSGDTNGAGAGAPLASERFEDVLLDPSATDGERDAAHDAAARDARLRDRLVSRQFVHGLLMSEAEAGTDSRERRLYNAMGKVGLARSEAVVHSIQKARRRMWIAAGIAALVVIAVSLTAVFMRLGGGTNEPNPNLANTNSPNANNTPSAPEQPSKAPAYSLVSGAVNALPATGGQWSLRPSGDAPATLRFGDGLVTLAAGSEVYVDSRGSLFDLRRGEFAIEGAGFRVPFRASEALLYGGPAVVSDGGSNAGVQIELFSGELKLASGESAAKAGQRVTLLDGNLRGEAAARLPDWVAAGRSEDVFREIVTITGGKAEKQRDAWMATLRPILSEAVTRAMVLDMTRSLIAAAKPADDGAPPEGPLMTADEACETLDFFGEVLQLLMEEARAKGLDYEKEVTGTVKRFVGRYVEMQATMNDGMRNLWREQRAGMLAEWRSMSAEKRAAKRSDLLAVIKRMLAARQEKPSDPGANDKTASDGKPSNG